MEGGGAELVDAIKRRDWREIEGLSERDRALASIAEKLSSSPTKLVERDWQPLRDLGFDDPDCLEVAHIVGIFNHLTRLADGFGLQLDAGTQEASRTATPLQRASNRG